MSYDSEYLLIGGIVNHTNDEVTFDPFYLLTDFKGTYQPGEGDYSLELRDNQNTVLLTHSFELSYPVADVMFGDGEPKDKIGFFVEVIPYPPETKTLVLKHNSTELASITVSDHTPNVTVIGPNGGETLSGVVNVTWSASDLDGDELHYIMEYSPDNGSTWQMLAIDFNETSYSLDTSYLQGTTEGLIRVTASDGVNTASAVSNAVFTVPEKEPEVVIVDPVNGTILIDGSYITLSGAGYDIEDEMLNDSALTWESDQMGVLGTGEELYVKILGRGVHTITLTGEDSDGNTVTDEVMLIVIDSASIDTPKGTAWISACDGVIIDAARVNESLLPPLPETDFPFGVFTFNISDISNGQTVNVSIDLPQDLPCGVAYWKYGRTIDDTTPHWYEIPMDVSEDNRTVTIQLTDGGIGDDDLTADGVIVVAGAPGVPFTVADIFDTEAPDNPYPSVSGIHKGTITLQGTLEVLKLYTYPCLGTGGHTEYVRIYGNGLDRSASWSGYNSGDWHNLTFDETFALEAGETYNYEIRTGSYPQIHHTDELEVAGGAGTITCTNFTDVNSKNYTNGIPAIRLSL
jgi:hypothetical protein